MENLVLVGFSCSGKTTIGRLLARRLDLRFTDTDRLIEDAAGCTVPELFERDGEAAFRALEREVVARVCERSGQVISTGGGAFVDPTNSALLREGNLVIHLQVDARTVVERLRGSRSGRKRPLLDAPDPLQRVHDLMAQRRPAYERAHVTVTVDNRTQQELLAELTRRWLGWRRAHRATEAVSS